MKNYNAELNDETFDGKIMQHKTGAQFPSHLRVIGLVWSATVDLSPFLHSLLHSHNEQGNLSEYGCKEMWWEKK